jgi:hypothetical protein
MGSRRYKQLNDELWLRNQYLTLKKSAAQIAVDIGASTGNSVRQALQRFEIPIRNRSEAQTIGNDNTFIFDTDVLYGSLLGDAGLRKSNNTDLTVPYFYKRNKYLDHVSLVASKLYYSDWKNRIIEEYRSINGVDCRYWLFTTPAIPALAETYKEWYPEGKKVIPHSLIPTPMMLHHWFLDDGSSYLRKRKTRQVVITLSSQCFSYKDQEMICNKMNNLWGLGFRVESTNSGTGFRIKLPQSKTDEFYELIGPSIVQSFNYKWK